MSMVHRLLEWEEGGLHQAKKLAAASSGGTSKAGAGLDKLTVPPSATDTVPKWNEGNANSSANRPRSVGLSRSKSKAMYFSKHRSHRSMEEGPSLPETTTLPVTFEDTSGFPGSTAASDPGVKMFVFPKQREARGDATNSHGPRRSTTASPTEQPAPMSGSEDDLESATTPIQFWSPVPAERSTPPFEPASTVEIPGGNRRPPPAAAPGSPSGSGGRANRMMSFFRRRSRSVQVAPEPPTSPEATREASAAVGDVPPAVVVVAEGGEGEDAAPLDDPATPPTPLSMASIERSRSAVMSVAAPLSRASVRSRSSMASPIHERPGDGDGDSSGGGGGGLPRAPFAGALDLLPPTPPSVYGGGNNGSEYGGYCSSEGYDEASVSTPSAQVATNRGVLSEADVEEGGFRAVMVSAAVGSKDAGTRRAEPSSVVADATTTAAPAVTVAKPLTYKTAEPAVIENGIVMPCPPNEREKILYHKTGRAFLVSTGTSSFLVATVGMWLFTISSPYFYWFGAPTVFLMFYLIFHYFVVAMWGKDFEPEDHAEIVRAAEEPGNPPPTVDVFLPVCREDIALLRNTWKYVTALDYPSFEVHVLDDGAKDDVRDMAEEFGFHYVRRDNRPEMKKAGNLRYTFARTFGEAIVIFDADFCPRSDFLKETTPYLADPTIGIIQTPQYFRYREEQTWVEKGAGASQEFFYRMVQMNQDKFHGSVCVGSCGVYRRSAVEPFGGVAAISHSEDMYTGYMMTELGYKVKYLPLCLAMGTCPDEPRSFFMQQYRWCMGSASLLSDKGFWKANLSVIHKICFLNGLLYYIATAMLLFVAPLPIILLIYLKAASVLWYYSGFALPSILMVTVAMPMWSKQPYGMPIHRVRVIQSYAHLSALMDNLMGTAAAWVPSGGGASRSPSKSYDISVAVMLTWTITTTVLIIGGSLWRMMEFTWYQYVPAIILAFGNLCLNLSSLR